MIFVIKNFVKEKGRLKVKMQNQKENKYEKACSHTIK